MSTSVRTISSASLAVFSKASGKPVAATSRDACAQALMYLSGIYGAQFQPSANAVLAWAGLFGDASPADIAEAVFDYLRSSNRDSYGRLCASFPPSAADIHALLRERAEAQRLAEKAAAADRQRAAAAFDERKRLIDAGVFLSIDPLRQQYLNSWASAHTP